MDPRELSASAYHEAGHAVLAWCLGNPVLDAGVAIDGLGSGHCSTSRRVAPGELLMCARRGDDFFWQRARRAAQYDIAEFQAGSAAERRFLGLGGLTDPELRRSLAEVVRHDSDEEVPRDVLIVLRTLAEIRLAETGRFAFGFDVWGDADTHAVMQTYRAVERGIAVTLSEERIWSAVEAVADHLVHERSLRAEQINAIIEGVDPPRLDRSSLVV